MADLPEHIAEYLAEAGCTQTEILILRHVLQYETMTLREMAGRTGKSTGVLDKAVRKLISKGIMQKQQMNGTVRYGMRSLQAVFEWVQEDMRSKHNMLHRKESDFQQFIDSVRQQTDRPTMEHYDGVEGMQKAYRSLLQHGGEIMRFVPTKIQHTAHELAEFTQNFFRERRRLGVFDRTITQENSEGRKQQSRDPFEFRETTLVPSDQLDLQFEKVVAGHTVACFDHAEQRACIIRFPHLAAAEASIFETMWRLGKVKAVVEDVLEKPIDALYDKQGEMKTSDVVHIANAAMRHERQDWVGRIDTLKGELHRFFGLCLLSLGLGAVLLDLGILPLYIEWMSQTGLPRSIIHALPILPVLMTGAVLITALKRILTQESDRWMITITPLLTAIGVLAVLLRSFSIGHMTISIYPLVVLFILSFVYVIYYSLQVKSSINAIRQPTIEEAQELPILRTNWKKRTVAGYAFRFAAVLVWGILPIFMRYTPMVEVHPLLRTLFMSIGATVITFCILLYRRAWGEKMTSHLAVSRNRLLGLIIATEVFYILFCTVSLTRTTSTNFLLFQNVAPVLALLAAAALWRQSISYLRDPKQMQKILLLFLLGSTGCSLIIYNSIHSTGIRSTGGDGLALMAMLFDTIVTIGQIRYMKKYADTSSIGLNLHVFGLMTLCLLPILYPIILFTPSILASLTLMPVLYAIGAGVLSGIGLMLNYEAFRRIDGFLAFLLFNVSILVTFVLEIWLFDAFKPTWMLMIGGFIVICASMLAEWQNRKAQQQVRQRFVQVKG